MKHNRILFAGVLVLFATLATLLPTNLHAQTNADVAKNAFAVTVQVNVNNFVYTPVTIPAGKRLVIENVNLSGAAQTDGPYVQPIVLISAALGSGSTNNHYFGPNPSTTDSTQYYADYSSKFYADTLYVSPAFAGFTPTFMVFNVVISGYLVDLPK